MSHDAAADANVERVRTKLLARSAMGWARYHCTTERTDLSAIEWLQHLQEELMDATVYIEAALARMRSSREAGAAAAAGAAGVAPASLAD